MAEIILFFSSPYQNYVCGTIQNLKVGNTEVIAGFIQKFTGADVFRIEAVQEYSKDYNECIDQAQKDQRRDARPKLKTWPENMDFYDTVYLGFPNYWGTMPMPVFALLEKLNLAGKTVCPFCTHEGSGFGNSLNDLHRLCPNAAITQGLSVVGARVKQSEAVVKDWLKQLNRKGNGTDINTI